MVKKVVTKEPEKKLDQIDTRSHGIKKVCKNQNDAFVEQNILKQTNNSQLRFKATCDLCKWRFLLEDSCRKHINRKHIERKNERKRQIKDLNFRCRVCLQHFNSKYNAHDHEIKNNKCKAALKNIQDGLKKSIEPKTDD